MNFVRRLRPHLVPALLLLLALWLRLRGLADMEFKYDEAAALRLGQNLLGERPWATDAPWPQRGMMSSQGVGNAPLFNSVMALFWWLTRDPVRATALVALANWLSLPALYAWARRRIGPPRALVFLALLGVSPFAVLYSRKLWAQDLLLPGLTLVLFGLERLQGASFWRGVGLLLLGLLPVTQLHQSGAILAAALALAIPLQWALDGRAGELRAVPQRPRSADAALIAVALALHAFFLLPYLQYLWLVPASTWANRPRLPHAGPGILLRLLGQLVPVDLVTFVGGDTAGLFHDTESTGRAGWLARNIGFWGAVWTGLPLALHGLWHWLKTPRVVPCMGLAWIFVLAAFTALRILPVPHYVLIVYPLPFLLLAGAFRRPDSEPPGGRLLDRALRLGGFALAQLRWVHVALLLVLTVSFQDWLWARGGSPGGYGVVYRERLAQAQALADVLAHPGAATPPREASFRCRAIPYEVAFRRRCRRAPPHARARPPVGGCRRQRSFRAAPASRSPPGASRPER